MTVTLASFVFFFDGNKTHPPAVPCVRNSRHVTSATKGRDVYVFAVREVMFWHFFVKTTLLIPQFACRKCSDPEISVES